MYEGQGAGMAEGGGGLPDETVIVFDRDGVLYAYESFTQVTDDLEAIDVDEGEYPAVYSPDGGVLELTAPQAWKGPVVLRRTGASDPGGLEAWVGRYWARYRVGEVPLGVEETVRAVLAEEADRGGAFGALWGALTGALRRGVSRRF
ncbi:hypothetical protein ABZX85_47820 [Streptomyces sp. NPDC004539]|uniref:hypothetical protein n=1 Tax=Streptomyces sp. NPDC004539 TaxID=3154280 RepID=UPI0033A8FBAC